MWIGGDGKVRLLARSASDYDAKTGKRADPVRGQSQRGRELTLGEGWSVRVCVGYTEKTKRHHQNQTPVILFVLFLRVCARRDDVLASSSSHSPVPLQLHLQLYLHMYPRFLIFTFAGGSARASGSRVTLCRGEAGQDHTCPRPQVHRSFNGEGSRGGDARGVVSNFF